MVLGAAGVAAGLPWADSPDPVIGLLIAIAILGVLRSAIVQVGARLLDAVDPGLVHQARDVILDAGDVLQVDNLRLRWIGHALHAQADITVADTMSLHDGHQIAHHVEQHLLDAVPRLTTAAIHVSPAGAHTT